jgi:DNA-binding XRE family transcriptional regulator
LYIWATTTGVHVRTLRQAARDGRLEVSYSARMFFGHAAPVATGTAVQRFKDHYYRRTTRWNRPTRPPSFAPPDDYDQRLIAWRRRMGLTQAALAVAIGAANRAVVYQWESHRRTPSPFFWKQIVELGRARGIAVHEQSSTARSAPRFGPCLLPADSAHQRDT